MLYIIGLGLNLKGISLEGISALKKCKKVYLENYTVEFPYSISELEKVLKRKIIEADRNVVESDILIKEALRENREPIFNSEDVGESMKLWEGIEYHKELQVGNFIVVLGTPNDMGQIEAKLIRLAPAPNAL